MFHFPEFIDVKGWKALGNKLIDSKLTKVEMIRADEVDSSEEIKTEETSEEVIDTPSTPVQELKLPSEKEDKNVPASPKENKDIGKTGLKPGDTIEFDF
jgi:topoisomerase-4 subunit A